MEHDGLEASRLINQERKIVKVILLMCRDQACLVRSILYESDVERPKFRGQENSNVESLFLLVANRRLKLCSDGKFS